MDALHDLFVSHSHRDERAVRRLAGKLKLWGFDIYVDFGDPALQEMMDRRLAERLKDKISSCRVFLFAFSSASAKSRWMPWELGMAHGVVGRVILWPLDAGAKKAVSTREYLTLYESIDRSKPEEHLRRVVLEARRSSIAPAHLDAMANLGEVTAVAAPRLHHPDVFTEFVVNGPAKLYLAWMNALMAKR